MYSEVCLWPLHLCWNFSNSLDKFLIFFNTAKPSLVSFVWLFFHNLHFYFWLQHRQCNNTGWLSCTRLHDWLQQDTQVNKLFTFLFIWNNINSPDFLNFQLLLLCLWQSVSILLFFFVQQSEAKTWEETSQPKHHLYDSSLLDEEERKSFY